MQGSPRCSVRDIQLLLIISPDTSSAKEAMMGRKLIVIATLISITVLVGILIIILHQRAEHEVLSLHQQYQLVHAQYAARQIETYLDHIPPTLSSLASNHTQKNNNIEKLQTKHHALTYVKELDAGYTTAISGARTGRNSNKDHSFLFNPVQDDEPGAASNSAGTDTAQANVMIFLNNYVKKQTNLKSQIPFVDATSVPEALAQILYQELQSIDSGNKLYQYWIIDSDGTLLFHSEHRNMEHRNIYRSGGQCQQCHASFDYVEEIISQKHGVFDFSVAGMRKLAAFTPVTAGNLTSILVAESPYHNVSAFSRKSLQGHLALLGIFVALVFVGALLINRHHRQKIQAEEETRHWMEKCALEKKIQKSDELYRTVVDTAHDVIWIFDVRGNFIFINHSAAQLTGYQPSDLIGKNYKPFLHPEDLQIVQAVFAEISHGERKSLELRAISKNGNLLLLAVNLIPLFEADKLISVAAFGRDITRRSQAEKSLNLERQILRTILDGMQYGAYIVDQKYRIEYLNPVLAAQFGAIQERVCYQYFHKKTEPCEWCKSQEVFSGKNVRWEHTSTQTGTIYSVFETQVQNEQGAVCKLSIFHDITERKQAEKALELERNKLIQILENMQHGVYIVSGDFQITYANPVIEKQFGPVNGRKCHVYFYENQEICPWCQIQKVLAGETVRYERSSPRNGKTYDIVATPMKNADGSVFRLSVISDITETKNALEDLQHSQDQLRRLSFHLLNVQDEERRRISREIHDDLGQTLTVAKLRLRFLQGKLSERQNELNQECEATIQDIDHLIEDVRRLSRNLSPAILEQLGLSAAARSLLRNFAQHSGVKVSFEIDDIGSSLSKSVSLSIYRVLQQALTNVDRHAGANNVFVFLGQNEEYIELTVEDDGKGFSVENLRSTEAKEKGLGLTIMEERARMLGGIFEIRSEEGTGTRLVLKIPVEKQETV